MGSAMDVVLPLGVGVAISPLPIIAVIAILFTPESRRTAPAFLLGWFLGLIIIIAIVLLVFNPRDFTQDGPANTVAIMRLVLGAVLLGLAVRRWRSRPAPGELAPPPRWMERLGELKPRGMVLVGALLGGINPKNLTLNISAASGVAELELGTGEVAAVMGVYVVVASVTVVTPIVLSLAAPDRAGHVLARWRDELALHRTSIAITLLLVFGFFLLGRSITVLSI